MFEMRGVTLPIEARTPALDFESFFRAEYRSLSQALLLLVGDAFEAEEIAQETMTRVLERWVRVGATITGRWEIAEDGTNYTTDFDLICRRVDA